MAGTTKLMTAGGGGVSLTPASSIASDVTVNLPVTGVNNGTLVCSDSSGNVGIGTSSPSAKLTIGGGNAGTYADGMTMYKSGGNIYALYPDANDLIVRSVTGSTEVCRFTYGGNLLVGTTAALPTNGVEGFAVQGGQTRTQRSSGGNFAIFYNTSNSAQIGSISNNGGTATTYSTSSDYRLKENIQPMQNALGVVAQLNPVTYTWKADGSDGQGFIAHELQAVVPDCVTGEKDAVDAEGNPVYQGIDTSFLVATLTKAIQEQQAQIETLTAKVAALEAK